MNKPLFTVNFSANLVSGRCPLKVGFSNETQPLPSPSPVPAESKLTPLSDLRAAEALPIPTAQGWHWDFGDGGSASGQSAQHLYNSPGTYTVSLLLVDSNGRGYSCVRPGYISVSCDDADLAVTLILQNRITLAGKTASADTCNLFLDPAFPTQRNANLWAEAVDWSCIPVDAGSGAAYGGVLVTPDILIQANHAHAPGPFAFLSADNLTETGYFLSGNRVSGTDIFVARLQEPLQLAKPSPVMSSADYSKISAAMLATQTIPVAFSNQFRQLRIGAVTGLQVGTYVWQPPDANLQPWYQAPLNGDSGSPVFFVLDNQPICLGTWFGSDFVDYSLAQSIGDYIDQINQTIAALGSQTRLRTVDLSGFKTP